MDSKSDIRKALFWSRRGRKNAASKLLRKVLIHEPWNEQALWLLAGITKDAQEMKQCLEKIVVISPENTKAKALLVESRVEAKGSSKSHGNRKVLALLIFLSFIPGAFTFLFFFNKHFDQESLPPRSISSGPTESTLTIESTRFPLLTPTRKAPETPIYTITPETSLPSEFLINNITGQQMKISLDCESNSAVIFAQYYGVEIDEVSFFINLPVSDNPDKGFVGDVHDEWGNVPPEGYGVYPAPVVAQLAKHGVQAKDVYNYTLDDLKQQIAKGNPVIVWVIGRVERGKASEYTSSDGLTHLVARYQHTVIVIGYDDQFVTILDGVRIYKRTYDEFLRSWNVLGNMAIIKSD